MKTFVTIRTKTSVKKYLQWKADKVGGDVSKSIRYIVTCAYANIRPRALNKYKPTTGGYLEILNIRMPAHFEWLTKQAEVEGISRGKFVENLILADKKAHEDLWGRK